MFDIGFSELLLIGIVALVVIGPERLPKVARTVGLLLGRVQRYVATVKADISQEMQLEELHRAGAALKESMQETRQQIGSAVNDLHQTIQISEPTAASELPSNVVHDGAAGEGVQIELALEPPVLNPVSAPLTKPAASSASARQISETEKADLRHE
ncbi:MAG: Sec-independent protein translocase protein TatB [Sulfuriferula sp.]